MTSVEYTGTVLAALPVALFAYAYLGYPAMLWLLARRPRWAPPEDDPGEWPLVTIVLPVYNEAKVIAATLDALLSVDYPPDRRQILVMSDASTDDTHAVVEGYAGRGVDLVVMPARRGKTAAENESAHHAIGSIVVNTDATTRVLPGSLKPLIRVFQDPTVGVASGRDQSAAVAASEANQAESGYVGYEMWVRDLETRCGTIVGASGCFMAVRRELFDQLFPEALSRDFAAPLLARRAGYRSVSVGEAVAVVPRARALRVEQRRKARTMARGLETLWHLRDLLNPFRHGRFAWMLWSHKAVRWLTFLVAPLGLAGLALLATAHPLALAALVLSIGVIGAGLLGIVWPGANPPPRPLAAAGYLIGSVVAALVAWAKAVRGEHNPIWEPTRR